MDTLAFVHAALSYENTKPDADLQESKINNLRAASSAIMAFIASGIVATALTYADNAQAALYYGKKGSDVAKLQAALGKITIDGVFGSETLARLKSYQAKNGLVVDGIAGSATMLSLGLSDPSQNLVDPSLGVRQELSQPEKYGRLRLINDTPYMVIVSLYKPEEKEPSRYAYISPYAERTLLDTYNSSWRISFNKHGKVLIADLIAQKNIEQKNNIFKINLSDLDKKDVLSASGRSKALKAELVNYQEVGNKWTEGWRLLMIPFREALEQGGKELPDILPAFRRNSGELLHNLKVASFEANTIPKQEGVMQQVAENTDSLLQGWVTPAIAKNPMQDSALITEALKPSYQQFKNEGVIFSEPAVFKKRFEKFLSELPPECQLLLNSISGTLSQDVAILVQAGYQQIAVMEEAANPVITRYGSTKSLSTPPIDNLPQARASNLTVQRILASCRRGAIAAHPRLILTNFSTQSQRIPKKCI